MFEAEDTRVTPENALCTSEGMGRPNSPNRAQPDPVRPLDRFKDEVGERGAEQLWRDDEPRTAERRRRHAPYCIERRLVRRRGDAGQWASSSESRDQ